jgi:hypothetical protein
LFAALPWRAEILADLVAAEGCGLGSDRRMLTVYGRSILDTHRLAERILAERMRFRRKPDRLRTVKPASSPESQLDLLLSRHLGPDDAEAADLDAGARPAASSRSA